MTQTKTAQMLLEEALSAISIGDLDVYVDGENLPYTSPEVMTLEWEFGGWVKGAEYDAADEYDETMIGEEKPKVGVCSIGAISLASLDQYQLGKVIPHDSYASFSQQAYSNKEVFKAGVFLAQAIIERYGSRLSVSEVDLIDGLSGVEMGFTMEDLMRGYEEKLTKEVRATNTYDYVVSGERRLDKDAAISLASGVITHFNDNERTTWEEVIDVFKAAIKMAIEEG